MISNKMGFFLLCLSFASMQVDDSKGRMGMKLLAMSGKETRDLIIEVLSSKSVMSVKVDGNVVYASKDRGIHCVVLSQATGQVTEARVFDTFVAGADAGMKDFLNAVTPGRLIAFGIEDDGAFRLGKDAREYLTLMGSKRAETLALRYLWAMVVQKEGQLLGEHYCKSTNNVWGPPVVLRVTVDRKIAVGVLSMTIISASPRHQRVVANVGFEIFCNADTVIDQCQFNMWDDNARKELLSVLDSSELSNEWKYLGNGKTISVRDNGTDLTQGRCSLMAKVTCGHLMFGCRVRTARHGWSYSYTTLYITSDSDPASDLFMSPSEDVFLPHGTAVNATCSSATGVACVFLEGTGVTRWSTSHTSLSCGATYRPTEDNKMIWCTIGHGCNYRGTMILLSQPPTSRPTLELSKSEYKVGEILSANCTVMASRPPANIAWYLGDDVLEGDDIEEVVDDKWRWSWNATGRTQILRRRLTEEDGGKRLTCEVFHFNVKQAFSVIIRVAVTTVTTTSTTSVQTSTTEKVSSTTRQQTSTTKGATSTTPLRTSTTGLDTTTSASPTVLIKTNKEVAADNGTAVNGIKTNETNNHLEKLATYFTYIVQVLAIIALLIGAGILCFIIRQFVKCRRSEPPRGQKVVESVAMGPRCTEDNVYHEVGLPAGYVPDSTPGPRTSTSCMSDTNIVSSS